MAGYGPVPGMMRSFTDLDGSDSDESDHEDLDTVALEEDTYSFGLVAIVTDLQKLAESTKHKTLRCARVCSAVLLVLLNVILQGYLLYATREFVTKRAVGDIRDLYDEYESTMYKGHTHMTVNGKARGVRGYFKPNAFSTFSDEEREEICSVAFSEPRFFYVVLLIWTLTMMGELRSCFEFFQRVIWGTTRAGTMRDAAPIVNGERIILRMTLGTKALVTGLIFLPRLGISFVLLWLGCRWLTATTSFDDMILNAVALEFIVTTKDILYSRLVSNRNKREVQKTHVNIMFESGYPSVSSMLGSYVWGLLSLLWVYVYIHHFQSVLPDYNWDIAQVCGKWLSQATKV